MCRNDVEDEATDVVSGCHGDDLMTPPDVLLQLALREAEKAPDDEASLVIFSVYFYQPNLTNFRLQSRDGSGAQRWLK